ncbi:MAG: Mov34/MPN/PAD-1 family protein [Methanomassiliicoccales archaeon]|nr:Mov34/MPN/PAD-1 family protein [Methanomassiliicoccales archaeon]
MKPPSVLAGEEIRIDKRLPPPSERRTAHKWLKEDALQRYRDENGKGFELYISKIAEEKIRNHATSCVDHKREVMGLMLGGVYTHDEMTYSLVRDVVTTDLEASSVHVKFQREAFEKLFASLDEVGFKYVIVGWYHSHPGHKCFMSSTDIDTQKNLFNQPYHNALVVDPVNREIEVYFMKDGVIRTRDFAIYWDDFENPYHGTTIRKRVVRSDPDRMASPH